MRKDVKRMPFSLMFRRVKEVVGFFLLLPVIASANVSLTPSETLHTMSPQQQAAYHTLQDQVDRTSSFEQLAKLINLQLKHGLVDEIAIYWPMFESHAKTQIQQQTVLKMLMQKLALTEDWCAYFEWLQSINSSKNQNKNNSENTSEKSAENKDERHVNTEFSETLRESAHELLLHRLNSRDANRLALECLNNQFAQKSRGLQRTPSVYLFVHFDTDSAQISGSDKSELQSLGDAFGDIDATLWQLHIIGHADQRGTSQYNQALSVARAQAVAWQLQASLPSRLGIVTEGRGESQLLSQLETNEALAKNRRVELFLRRHDVKGEAQ